MAINPQSNQGMGGMNPWMFMLLPFLQQMFGGGGGPFAQTGMGGMMGGGLPSLSGQSVQPPPSPQAAPPGTSQMTTPPIGQVPAPAPLPVNTALPQAPQPPPPAMSPLGGATPGGPTPPAPGMSVGGEARSEGRVGGEAPGTGSAGEPRGAQRGPLELW